MSDQLTAIDDALESGAADHDDPLTRELQELALALRADVAEPDDEFRHELGRRVRSGFPKPASLRRPLWRRALTPAFATGLVALPIVLIAVLAGGGSQDQSSSGDGGGGGDDAGAAAPAIVEAQPSPELRQFERANDQAAASSGPAVPDSA